MQSGSATASPYPPPQAYSHPGSHGYGPPGTTSENSTAESYDYRPAIDPALEGGAAQMQENKRRPESGDPPPEDALDQPEHRGISISSIYCTSTRAS